MKMLLLLAGMAALALVAFAPLAADADAVGPVAGCCTDCPDDCCPDCPDCCPDCCEKCPTTCCPDLRDEVSDGS